MLPLIACTLSTYAAPLVLASPSDSLKLTLSSPGGRLTYTLARGGKTLVEPSRLGLVFSGDAPLDGVKSYRVVSQEKQSPTVYPAYAQAGVKVPEVRTVVEFDTANGKAQIEFRLADYGLAWRQSVPRGEGRHVALDRAEWNLPAGGKLWTEDAGSSLGACEGIWGVTPIDEKTGLHAVRSGPVTADLGEGRGYLFISEAANFDLGFGGVKYVIDGRRVGVSFVPDPTGFTPDDKAQWSPWRVTVASPDLDKLAMGGFIETLAPAPDPSLFPRGAQEDWIKPGRAAWSWWDASDVSYEAQQRYTDMAAEFGFENNLIDEGWESWKGPGKDKWDSLRMIVEYGKAKGVGQWVWKHWSQIGNPENDWQQMREFMDKVKAAGVAGMKIDFMDSDSQQRRRFYDAAMRQTALRHLMINFHGANIPGGENMTYPNQLTREGIFGMEQNRWTQIPPRHYAALPFTRLAAGPADFTPGYFGHDLKRLGGSTWTLQLATGVMYTSPALHWISNPDDMRAAFPAGSPEREVIKSIPPTWDETRVLPGSEIGGFVLMARRKGSAWYLAGLNGGYVNAIQLRDLSFLGSGTYDAIAISDGPNAVSFASQGGIIRFDAGKPDAWTVTKEVTDKTTPARLSMPTGGGIVIRFTPHETRSPLEGLGRFTGW